MAPTVAPHGSWRSPITAASIASESVALAEPSLSGDALWWIESRPLEQGRQAIVRATIDGADRRDVLGAAYSARTRVHEYGGGAYTVVGDAIVFSNDSDGRAYVVRDGDEPRAITPEPQSPRSLRYADFAGGPAGRVFCVRESHETAGEAVNEIVVLDLAGNTEPVVVASGHDFYAAPRVSPDGERLAWLSWDHPRMPWDGTELWTAAIDGSGAEQISGGPAESIFQPEWSPDGRLHWVSDRSGWWNLYRDGEALYPAEAEFGMPMWVFGLATYAFLADGRIACVWNHDGLSHVGLLDPGAGTLDELDCELVPALRSVRISSHGDHVAYVGASATSSAALVVVDAEARTATVLARSAAHDPDARYLSEPQPLDYPSHGRTAHALFYPPRNDDFAAPADELPPLLVISHGGPTSQTEPALDLKVQYWTSRGIAVVDVNYGGSTGYGREYRELLRGEWGVVDLQDCVEAALHLAREGKVDRDRLAIRGGSAGGYTTLCALTFTDVFHVGASYYGIADLGGFADDTHKFESRYDQALVPADKRRERSPINFVERISAPVIVFQGLEDAIVPPNQAELIVDALEARGIEHEYHAYEGEAHGFRGSETIIDSLQAELAFYGRVLGFEPARPA